MTVNILVVINAEAPSAAMHAAASRRSQPRKAPDGSELPPNPVLECQSMDTSHSSLLHVTSSPGPDGKTSGAWIPYGHVLAIIECETEIPASVGFVRSSHPSTVETPA